MPEPPLPLDSLERRGRVGSPVLRPRIWRPRSWFYALHREILFRKIEEFATFG
jgi:hypothetical protein